MEMLKAKPIIMKVPSAWYAEMFFARSFLLHQFLRETSAHASVALSCTSNDVGSKIVC